MKFIFESAVILFMSLLFTSVIYLWGAFILWDIWPDDPDTKDNVFISVRIIFFLSFIASCAVMANIDKNDPQPK
jgi:hypothetical protein